MKRFITNFFEVPYDRKIEVKNQAIEIETVVKNYFNGKNSYTVTVSHKLDRAYAFYKKIYKEDLTDEEKSIFFLYVLFPDDTYFDELIMRYDKDFNKISTLFAINQFVVKLRYLLEKNIEKENEEVIEKKKM